MFKLFQSQLFQLFQKKEMYEALVLIAPFATTANDAFTIV
jgi:hypothetical protein